jgi:transcriptional regulator with XRE-family HTH domain
MPVPAFIVPETIGGSERQPTGEVGMSELAKAFGDALRRLRADRGLTQPQLADAAGLSEEWIRRIERGSASPSFETIEALAKALDADVTPPIRAKAPGGRVKLAQLVAEFTDEEAEWAANALVQLRARPGR